MWKITSMKSKASKNMDKEIFLWVYGWGSCRIGWTQEDLANI